MEIVESEELNHLCRLFEQGDPRGRFASRVKVVLHDGSELSSGLIDGGLAYPSRGWNEDVMEEKFRWLVVPVVGETQTEQLIELIWSFADQPGMSELIRLSGGRPNG